MSFTRTLPPIYRRKHQRRRIFVNHARVSFMVTLAEALLYTLYDVYMHPEDKGKMEGWLSRQAGPYITIVVSERKDGRNYCTIEQHNTYGLGEVGFRAYRENPDQITRLFQQRLREWDSCEGPKPVLMFGMILPDKPELDLAE